MDKITTEFKDVESTLNKRDITLNQIATERNQLIKDLASSENQVYATEKKYGKMKKLLKEYDDEIAKKDEKIRILKLEAKNNELVDQIYDGDTAGMGLGNELGDLEEFITPSPRHKTF